MSTSRPSSPFRLGTLLDQHALGLELAVGGERARERRISGVHAIEIERPARWLAPDWVMLTTGVRLVDAPDAQAALPGELADAGVTALGFGCELEFEAVPERLLRAAEEIDFPVFAIPLRTPFREIEAFVQHSLLSTEMRSLQRLSSMQRYLVDALYSFEPQRTVVHRLAALLEASAAVISPDGRVLEGVGELPGDLTSVLTDPVPGVRDVELGDWRVVATPIVPDADDPDGRWIVVATVGRGLHHRVTRPVLQAAAPLLAAVGRLEETVRQQDRAVRRSLLEDLISHAGDEQSLVARASASGIDLHRPAAIVTLDGAGGPLDREARDRLERRTVDRLTTRGLDHLSSYVDDHVVALVSLPAGEAPDELLDDLADGDALVGVGRPGTGAASVARSAADAAVAIQLAGEAGTRRWQRYEDVDLPALVVGHVPLERLGPQVERITAALDSRPGLREALLAYFAHDQDITLSAQALHLHPNSLRYRLGRLADALGRPLRDPWTIAALVLALEIERRGPEGGTAPPA